jgi:serine/threonine-protein kinase PknG
VPPVPYRDPATAVLTNPQVPENKRFCSRCDHPVGRGRDGQSARSAGFCRNCGARYSFTPKLAAGDVVAGQYEVLGCLAHGGLGWIYLARDRNVSDRWVVLKGLLDSADPEAMAAAVAERQFLATVEHPNIVKIYNFVQHPEPDTGIVAGYIVMEYVGGQSLKEMLRSRRPGSLPLSQAIAFALEVLRALGYLHSLGLVYCDFKPDNVIQSEEQLKLIDLGGVRRIDDESGAIYGTAGYQAPEVGADGPSVGSDLYTVARTLAVLTFEFKGYSGDYATSLPPRASVPLLTEHESFDRLLRRATHQDPGRRFTSAAEMADQLTGVLREVLAREDGEPRPAVSSFFEPPFRTAVDLATASSSLPGPLTDPADPAAGFLAGLNGAAAADVVRLLSRPPVPSREVSLRLARALIEVPDQQRARELLAELSADDPLDWRTDWYVGLADLAAGRYTEARNRFDLVYSELPGETAPKLALATAAELGGDQQAAAAYYELAWTTDRSYTSAAFGAARSSPGSAIRVLDSVPASSIYFTQAQVAAITARIGREGKTAPQDVIEAGMRLQALGLDAERRELIEAEVLEAALAWTLAGGGQWPASQEGPQGWDGLILGQRLTERELRLGLERTYRALAHLAKHKDERIALVERANSVRPRTLI